MTLAQPGPNNVAYEAMGKLTSHPPTVRKVQQLMRAYGNGRDDFAMHVRTQAICFLLSISWCFF